MTDTMRYAAIMLAAGVGIPLLAALNAQLGARIGSPTAAAVVLFCVALVVSLAAMGTASTSSMSPVLMPMPRATSAAGSRPQKGDRDRD